MPTLDLSRAVLLTEREKAKGKELVTGIFNKILSGLVPPSSQQEYELMKKDPWQYLQSGVRQPPPLVKDMPGTVSSLAGAMPIAFHGTPHTWEGMKPDISKVGTGQGAQSYGHGLYFAENPEVAKTYMAERHVGQTGKGWGIFEPAPGRHKPIAEFATEKEAQAAFKETGKYGGSQYQVNIPDEHVAKMLDWDKPLSEQPEVLKAVKSITGSWEQPEKWTGQEAYRILSNQANKHGLTGQEAASNFLKEAGIPGIKYLDQGSRNVGGVVEKIPDKRLGEIWRVTSPDGISQTFMTEAGARAFADKPITRNFVIFDPEIIKDVKRK